MILGLVLLTLVIALTETTALPKLLALISVIVVVSTVPLETELLPVLPSTILGSVMAVSTATTVKPRLLGSI